MRPVRQVIRISAAIILLLVTSNPVFAQTLEQSVSFILSGGSIDVLDIKPVDADTVSANVFGGWQKLKVVDRKQCVFRAFHNGTDQAYLQYNLNNIVLSETQLTESEFTILDQTVPIIGFKGEDDIFCNSVTGCSKSYQIMVSRSNLERVTNAIKYVYSNFCAAAKRKSAF